MGKEQNQKRRSQKVKKGIRDLVFLAVVVGIAYMALGDSREEIWQEIQKTSAGILLGIFLCCVMYHTFEGFALTGLLKSCDETFHWWQGIFCSLYSGFFRVATFGSGTAAAGMYYVSRLGIRPERSLGIFTINYTIQRIVICLYFVVSFLLLFPTMSRMYGAYSGYMAAGILLAVLVAAVLILLCVCEPLHRAGFLAIRKFMVFLQKPGKKRAMQKKRIAEWERKVDEYEEKAEIVRKEAKLLLKQKKLLARTIFWNICKMSMWYLIPVLLFGAQPGRDMALYMAVTAMVTALAGVIPAPGGVGAVEYVFLLLFTPLTGKIAAASGMLLYRFATYILPAILGAVVVLRNHLRPLDI